MKPIKKSEQEILSAEEKLLVEAVNEHFWFLVKEYQFVYKRTHERSFQFTSPKIWIELRVGHKSPRILVRRIGEPEFTSVIFERIVQYLERRLEIDNLFSRYYPHHPLNDNIRFVAELFKRYSDKIISQIDEWWIPVQVFQYELMEKDYKDAGQLEDFQASFKRHFDYLKGKGAI